MLFYTHVWPHTGFPAVIISDRDPKIIATFWQELWNIIGTRLNISTARHAQTDGRSERRIRVLMESVRTFAMENPLDWDLYLPSVNFAYNDSIHPFTGYTPFQLDNGRDPNTPIKLIMHGILRRPTLFTDIDGYLNPSAFLSKIAHSIEVTKTRLRAKAQQQRNLLDQQKSVPIQYNNGDYAYLQNPDKNTPGQKTLDPRYLGPYKILDHPTDNTYKLQFPFGSRAHPVVNENKLIPYRNRDTGLPYPEQEVPDPTNDQNSHIIDIRVQTAHNDEKYSDIAQVKILRDVIRWTDLYTLVRQNLYQEISEFLNTYTNIQQFYPLFKRIHYSENGISAQGFVCEADKRNTDEAKEFPYRVIFSDGGEMDISESDFNSGTCTAASILTFNKLERESLSMVEQTKSLPDYFQFDSVDDLNRSLQLIQP
jgi:hypothetical protein